MIRFEFVGKISKDGIYEKNKLSNNFAQETLRFNGLSNLSHYMFTNHNKYYCDYNGDVDLSSNTLDTFFENDGKLKYTRIPLSQKDNAEIIQQVADYKKYVIDLNDNLRRKTLIKMLPLYATQTVTESKKQELGIYNLNSLKEEISKCNKNSKSYIYEGDFISCLKNDIDSGVFKDKKIRISGEYKIKYIENKNQYFYTFSPQKISLTNDDDRMQLTLEVLFTKDSFIDNELRGWVEYYDYDFKNNKSKGTVLSPITITVDREFIEKYKPTNDNVYKIGMVVDYINGANIITENGKKMIGYKQSNFIFSSLSYNYLNGCKMTKYQIGDLHEPILEVNYD